MKSDKPKGSIETQVIRGRNFPATKRFTKKNIEDAMDYVPKDGDLIIASYPKTGRTWMQYIVLQILSDAEYFPSFIEASFKIVPFLELAGIDAVEALQKPRCYKHHIAYDLVQKNDKSKCIYIYRHPEDTVVSYYHFISDMDKEVYYDFDEFFEKFISGNISYGSYFKHVLSFYEHKDDDNLLMVSYEKLQTDKQDEILRIAKFMDEKYYENLISNREILDKIMKHTSFEYMKTNLHFTNPFHKQQGGGSGTESSKDRVNFFRKGIVGDGKNKLSETQQQRLREVATDLLKETTILQEWYPE